MKKILLFLTTLPVLLLSASPVFAGTLNFGITPPAQTVPGDDVTIQSVINFILNTLVAIGIIASLAYLLYGGIKWITSGGDKGAVESARQHIIAAIIGLLVVTLAFVILRIVFTLLGIEKPEDMFSFSIPTL